MRIFNYLTAAVVALVLGACTGIETEPAETGTFAAGGHRYYVWRTAPLENTANSRDPVYQLDGMVRDAVDNRMAELGYVESAERATFNIDYIAIAGVREGVAAEQASNINPWPQAVNRQVDGASVDNAIALSGGVDTRNIALLFRDNEAGAELWRVIITKIVEDANISNAELVRRNVTRAINRGLSTLPRAP